MATVNTTKLKQAEIDSLAAVIIRTMRSEGLQVTSSDIDNAVILEGFDVASQKRLRYELTSQGIKGSSPKDLEQDGKSRWSSAGLSVAEDLTLQDFSYNPEKGMYSR